MAFPDDDKRYGGQYAGHGRHGLPSWASAEYKAVTPNDSADIDASGPCIALLVGVAGDVSVVCPVTGQNVTLPLIAGYNPIRTQRVRATGTTATGIVALF